MNETIIKEFLKTKNGRLFHRESQELEFKEQFNFGGLADYFKDFAAFANNRGGYLIFGVKDSPRILTGLNKSSKEQFEKIDPQTISGYLLNIFSSDIRWKQFSLEISQKFFGGFYIFEGATKPIIAKKDEGKDQIIKNGEVYYRYGGRTQKIQYAELENIIDRRVEKNNKQWLDLMSKIGKAGPSNAAVLDTEKGIIEKNDSQVLVIEETLIDKIKFIKEGDFLQKDGESTLKLIGDVVPIDKVEIIRKVKENILKAYPFSALELVSEIRRKYPDGNANTNTVWEAIRENDVKNNSNYSVYNFRNKKQEDTYKKSGVLPSGVPSIYNNNAVDFLVNVLKINT